MTINSFADVSNASLQEIFDHVAPRLLTQNKKSMIGEDCCYLSDDGCRCAIGHLMSQEEAAYYAKKAPYCISGWDDLPSYKQDLLSQLMDCHDEYDVEHWPEGLRQIADRFSLECNF